MRFEIDVDAYHRMSADIRSELQTWAATIAGEPLKEMMCVAITFPSEGEVVLRCVDWARSVVEFEFVDRSFPATANPPSSIAPYMKVV